MSWEVVDSGGVVHAQGTVDLLCLGPANDSSGQAATCAYQQLLPGAASNPAWTGSCRLIDITDLAPSTYTLRVMVDPQSRIAEAQEDNNTVEISFTVPDVECTASASLCGQTCCPWQYDCLDGVCQLPDLTVDQALLASSMSISVETFGSQDCNIVEGCLQGSGERRLLRFSASTPNTGLADFFIGDPTMDPNAQWSPCHNHLHYHQYARYRLLDAQGNPVVPGTKQAFCVVDVQQFSPDAGPGKYTCEFQGITRGWTDIYSSGLDCQWIDITGVPPGQYTVEVTVNPEGRIAEMDHTNNVALAPVEITADPNTCVSKPETCGDGIDQDCNGIADNGCPPISGNHSCSNAHPISASGIFTAELSESPSPLEASCGAPQGPQAVFRLNVTTDQIAYLSTYGSEVDTVLEARSGDCSAPTASLCSDDECNTVQSHLAEVLMEGPYSILVRAKNPQETGLVTLNVQLAGPSCADARFVQVPGIYHGSFSGRTDRESETCQQGSGPDEVLVLTSCPGETPFFAHTCQEPAADTVLELRRGACHGPVSPGACNDDGQLPWCPLYTASYLATSLVGDGLWFLVVDAWTAGETADYNVVIQSSPLDAGQSSPPDGGVADQDASIPPGLDASAADAAVTDAHVTPPQDAAVPDAQAGGGG
jgi:hypothetical protein